MSIKEEIKNSKFGISEVHRPTPRKMKLLAEGMGAFCTIFGTSLAAAGYGLAGLITSGIGLFCDKFLIKLFSDPDTVCVTEDHKEESDGHIEA